jgi:hypothetical protein
MEQKHDNLFRFDPKISLNVGILKDADLEASDIYYLFNYCTEIHKTQFDSLLRTYSKKELEKKVFEFSVLSPYTKESNYLQGAHFVYIGLLIDRLFNEIKRNKQLYFMHNHYYVKEQSKEQDLLVQQLQEELSEIKQREKQKTEELSAKNKIIKEFQKEKESLLYTSEKRIKKLEKQAKQHEKEVDELAFLREFYYQHKQEEKSKELQETRIVKEEDIVFINNKQLLIIGGKENWKTSLSQRIRADFLYYEQSNFDEKTLHKYEYVFFNTNYMNHGMFYKAMNELKKYNIPFGFLNRTNIEYNILEIIDHLNK